MGRLLHSLYVNSCQRGFIKKQSKAYAVRRSSRTCHRLDQGQMRLARPHPGGLFEDGAAQTQTLDPEIAVSCRTALSTHGQRGRPHQGLLLIWEQVTSLLCPDTQLS